jgi:hypothetical protein
MFTMSTMFTTTIAIARIVRLVVISACHPIYAWKVLSLKRMERRLQAYVSQLQP